jgi:hypothetical protein
VSGHSTTMTRLSSGGDSGDGHDEVVLPLKQGRAIGIDFHGVRR